VTLINVVLTDGGLLVAADSRQALLQLGGARDDVFKIKLVDNPPRTVFCVSGVDVIYDVTDPSRIRPGWSPSPSEIIVDLGGVAEARLGTARAGLNQRLLTQVATDCVLSVSRNPRLNRSQLASHAGRPFSQLIVTSAARTGRSGRLGVVDLWVRTDAAEIRTKEVRCRDLWNQGDPYFFGDLSYVERELPAEYQQCKSELGRSPLPVAGLYIDQGPNRCGWIEAGQSDRRTHRHRPALFGGKEAQLEAGRSTAASAFEHPMSGSLPIIHVLGDLRRTPGNRRGLVLKSCIFGKDPQRGQPCGRE